MTAQLPASRIPKSGIKCKLKLACSYFTYLPGTGGKYLGRYAAPDHRFVLGAGGDPLPLRK